MSARKQVTVGQLIKILSIFDEDLPVFVRDWTGDHRGPKRVVGVGYSSEIKTDGHHNVAPIAADEVLGNDGYVYRLEKGVLL